MPRSGVSGEDIWSQTRTEEGRCEDTEEPAIYMPRREAWERTLGPQPRASRTEEINLFFKSICGTSCGSPGKLNSVQPHVPAL